MWLMKDDDVDKDVDNNNGMINDDYNAMVMT